MLVLGCKPTLPSVDQNDHPWRPTHEKALISTYIFELDLSNQEWSTVSFKTVSCITEFGDKQRLQGDVCDIPILRTCVLPCVW